MKLDKLYASEIQWWNRHRIEILIPKGRNWNEWRNDRFQEGPSLASKYHYILRLKNNLLWFDAMGASVPPVWLCWAQVTPPRPWAAAIWPAEVKAIPPPLWNQGSSPDGLWITTGIPCLEEWYLFAGKELYSLVPSIESKFDSLPSSCLL